MITKQNVHYFLTDSQTFLARFLRMSIVTLIMVSSALAIIQLLQPGIFGVYGQILEQFEWIVLGIFTLEFAVRWLSSPTQKQFWNSATTWIDAISIVPFYFGITNLVALRLFRVFRIFKLSRKGLLNFFDSPTSLPALWTRFGIIALIVISASLAIAQMAFPEILEPYKVQIDLFEYAALAIFTVEFFTRLFASVSVISFFTRPANWIDLMAIAPFYFGLDNALLLRVFRVLRLFKIFNSLSLLRASSVFDFKNSILRIVTPLISVFIFLKAFVWILESRGWWFPETSFGTLFTIMGFSLGVVLSQKIGRSYGKYIQVQDGMYRLHGKLVGLQQMLNTMSRESGDRLIFNWLEGFMRLYKGDLSGTLHEVRVLNQNLYRESEEIGNTELIPFHRLAAMLSAAGEQAVYIQSKRTNRTPVTYNLLLQQIIIMYLVLIVVFIPGIQGMVSVVFAGYLLYGLFQITNDFDHVSGTENDGNLITVDAVRINNYLEELRSVNTNSNS